MSLNHEIRELPADWTKINLGCNDLMLAGWINVDIYPFTGADVVADLNEDWPWRDNSIQYIRAFDVVEHLRDSVHTMNEAYRILKHGGILEVFVPSTDGRGAFQDPTHVSFWNRNSFSYYSKHLLGGLYPNLIKCDFEIRLVDTIPNASQIIWTWALCRAQKISSDPPVISDAWYGALSDTNMENRVIPGYKGCSLGTSMIEA